MFRKILVIASVAIFGLAAFGVTFAHVVLIPLGLSVYAARLLVDKCDD